MSENCDHDCNSCKENCSDRNNEQFDFSIPQNANSHIKNVIGIVSGKAEWK